MKYAFEDFTLDTSTRELSTGGAPVPVEPMVFEVLVHLIENFDRVVTKDELVTAVWDGRFISDAAVSSALSAARRAVGDNGQDQRVVKTVHGRGFRFVAPLTSESQAAVAGRSPELTPVAARKRILIRPFTTAQGASELWIGELVSNALVTEISRFRSVDVVADGTAAGASQEAETGDTNAAEYTLTGMFCTHEAGLRLNVQLTDCSDGRFIWTERFDADGPDKLKAVDGLAGRVAATLIGRVEASEQAAARSRPASDLSITDRLSRAHDLYARVSPLAMSEGLEALREVLIQAPDNTRALTLTGAIHDMAYFTGWTEDAAATLDKAIEYGRQGVASDPTDSQAHAHLGEAYLHARRNEEARSHFERAISLNPNDVVARTLYAAYLRETGEAERALQELLHLSELDPFGLNWIPWVRAEAHFALADYPAALTALHEIHIPFNAARPLLAACYALLDRLTEARRTIAEFCSVARNEMAQYPESADAWRQFFQRENSNRRDEQFEIFFNALMQAGLADNRLP